MNRAELDAAYDNSAAVPGAAYILAGWAQRSARVRRERAVIADLAYGPGPRQRLDLILADDPFAPTLAWIHGGYWQWGEKETYAFLAEGTAPLGINLALVEYGLAPAVRMDAMVAEIAAALSWLEAYLAQFGADGGRLFLAGHSAGGHLTATAIALPAVKGALAISGIFDLEPIRLGRLNDALAMDAAEAARHSPLRHLPAAAPPLIVAWGEAELPELRRQSAAFAAAWAGKGLPGRALAIPGADHFSILESLARPDGVLAQAVVDLTR